MSGLDRESKGIYLCTVSSESKPHFLKKEKKYLFGSFEGKSVHL